MLPAFRIIDALLPFTEDESCCSKQRIKAAERSDLLDEINRYKQHGQIRYDKIPKVNRSRLMALLTASNDTRVAGVVSDHKVIKEFKSYHGRRWHVGEVINGRMVNALLPEERMNIAPID